MVSVITKRDNFRTRSSDDEENVIFLSYCRGSTLVIMFTKWRMKDLKRNFADTPRTRRGTIILLIKVQKHTHFSIDRQSIANYIYLRHTYCIILVQALTATRLVTSCPAQIEIRRQESTFVVKKLFFCDISLAKRASIMRVAPLRAVGTCSPKTSLVLPYLDSFGTEGHRPSQNLPNHLQAPLPDNIGTGELRFGEHRYRGT